ncbi:hypothetical protein ACHAXT_003027 [Thalassiosira profunda]
MIVPDLRSPRLLPLASGGAINVVPAPLRRDDPSSPWCYAASLAPAISLEDDAADAPSSPSPALPPGANFLATQVWPSSRIASAVIERHADPSWAVCELGCGPGLPSLTAAKCGARRVIATDVDEVALEMVRAAAIGQGFMKENDCKSNANDVDDRPFVTKQFDLMSPEDRLPEADLYILSDVFESASVAEGAAWHVQSLLSANRRRAKEDMSRVWVFAQSDRAQRDAFLAKMIEWYESNGDLQQHQLCWSMNHEPDPDKELWLFDLDETTTVDYN